PPGAEADRRHQGPRWHHARRGQAQVPREAVDAGAAGRVHPDPAALKRSLIRSIERRIPGWKNRKPQRELGPTGCQSCPYRLRTMRQPLPTRELLAASVAPQRSRLLHVIPPERPQNRAAAGRQGTRSFLVRRLAAVTARLKT